MYKHYGLLLKEKRGIEEEEAYLSKHNDKIKLLSVEDSSSPAGSLRLSEAYCSPDWYKN
ncbi:hypothetical protein [Aneurinibacillus migulanus]|uniref:hypothetical protein n=1 Tax=Aneurinibacillus migulanus TaxID=47500 RepID=UPI000A5B1F06|nr:hypothetical protein [Aneurinibacillus migulanus]